MRRPRRSCRPCGTARAVQAVRSRSHKGWGRSKQERSTNEPKLGWDLSCAETESYGGKQFGSGARSDPMRTVGRPDAPGGIVLPTLKEPLRGTGFRLCFPARVTAFISFCAYSFVRMEPRSPPGIWPGFDR